MNSRRKAFTAAALVAVSLGAAAQTYQDARTFAENNYAGTARSVGLGNAMTAVGGDAGSLTFNPAGSAVSAYSQLMITPSLSIASTSSTGTAYNGVVTGYQDSGRDAYTRMKMPNIGFILYYDTHNSYGLKGFSVGFVGNATNDYTRKFIATGTNGDTSVAAGMASDAEGFPVSTMNGDWYQSSMPSWQSMTAYKSGMFSPVTGVDGSYVAATEKLFDNGDRAVAGMLDQSYGQQRRGNKYDALLNIAANFSDKFYLGANLGLQSISYSMDEFWSESAQNPSDFTVKYDSGRTDSFDNLRMRYSYRATGSGVYAKAGFIWRPFGGLRIGAAIQTPTYMEIKERYGYDGKTVFTSQTLTAQSPEDSWEYDMTLPFRVNAGLAYTFGKVALLSADYEYVNYSQCRFKPSEWDDADFSGLNTDVNLFLGPSHMLRTGIEIHPVPQIAVRGGYNLTVEPEMTVSSGESVAGENILRHSGSFGLGYSSGGSFFADFAVRAAFLPYEYIIPYDYYYVGTDGYSYIDDTIITPEIAFRKTLVDVILTLGWRF